MNHARVLGLLLVSLQSMAIGYCFEALLFSGIVLAAAGFAAISKWRFATPQSAKRWPIIFVVFYLVARLLLPAGRQGFLVPDACLIAQHLVVYQLGLFFVRWQHDRPPTYFPILAIVAMTFTGDVQVQAEGRLVFQILSLSLVILFIGYFLACRHSGAKSGSIFSVRRRWLLVIVALVCSAASWASASNLYRYARDIEATMNRYMNPSLRPESAGFSGQGRLGSVAKQKGASGESVTLRVYGEEMPGYLRGKVFETYRPGQWQCLETSKPLNPIGKSEFPVGFTFDSRFGELFALPDIQTGIGKPLDIWPNQNFQDVLFTPLGVPVLQAPVNQLSVNTHRVVSAEEMPAKTSYVVWRSPSEQNAVPLKADERQKLTALPDGLDPRVLLLADKLLGEAGSTIEKTAAVENYFLDNYEYQIGIEIPSQIDPITYFLLERPPGHCEYFASGAVILLRSAGVPCRYVTGFVAAEKNKYGDYWVARNRDAHAWVEAYDDERGWVLVEATPASGVPQQTSPPTTNQIWDAFIASWQRLIGSLRRDGLSALVQWISRLSIHPLTLIAVVILVFGFATRRFLSGRIAASTEQVDPHTKQLHVLLGRMDQHWKRQGLDRRSSETLHQFALRLESAGQTEAHSEAASWYRTFAAIRYSGNTNNDTIESLGASIVLPTTKASQQVTLG